MTGSVRARTRGDEAGRVRARLGVDGVHLRDPLDRHDFARAAVRQMSPNPHTYLVWGLLGGNAAEQAVGLGALAEAAGFIVSNGLAVPDVNPLVQPIFNRSVFGVPGNLFDRLPIP